MNNIKKVRNPGDISQLEHSDSSDARRVVDCGLVIGLNKKDGTPGIHSDISTAAVFVGEKRHLLLTNTDTAVQYVTFGDSSVAVASASNGVPILPGGQLVVCSGESEFVRASSTDVHCVEIAD